MTLALLEKGPRSHTHALDREEADADNADARQAFESFRLHLRSENLRSNLTLANALFYGQSITLRPDFLAKAECLSTEVRKVDFQEKAAAREKINNWASEATHGKIGRIVSPSDIREMTQAILTNAAYLNAAWDGQCGPFHLLPTQKPFYQFGRTNESKQVKKQKTLPSPGIEPDTFCLRCKHIYQ